MCDVCLSISVCLCLVCVSVGALINVGSSSDDVYPCESLAQFDMSWTEHDIDLVDNDAAEYLKDTLSNFRRVRQ